MDYFLLQLCISRPVDNMEPRCSDRRYFPLKPFEHIHAFVYFFEVRTE